MSGPDAPLRLAITGTDTGVGKTLVSCALLAALRARGIDARAMKPVETGITGRHAGTDGARLHRAAGGAGDADDVCPATYAEPLAPLVAAERARRPLDVARLDAAAARLEAGADALDFAGLAVRWALDVVVVAADRLGVLNHALLTVREAERRGLRVRAVALHPLQAGAADPSAASNAAVLARLLGAVPLVTVPYLDGVAQEDPAALAAAGDALARVLLAPP